MFRAPFQAAHLRAVCPPRAASLPQSLRHTRPLADLSISSSAQSRPTEVYTAASPSETAPNPETQPPEPSPKKVTRILHIRPFQKPTTSPSSSSTSSEDTNAASHTKEAYVVARTATNNLPVYEQKKRGGSLQQTLVRRVSGESAALRDQLKSVLQPEPKNVAVNPLTKHVVIKGFYKEQVLQFLRNKGF